MPHLEGVRLAQLLYLGHWTWPKA